MLRKDFFLAEMERLAQALAKIIGLKNQEKPEESKLLLEDTLIKDFNLEFTKLLILSEEDFKSLVNEKKYPAQKLDILGQLLFEESQNSDNSLLMLTLLKKVLLIFDSLERDYHVQSLENIRKRSKIENIIKQLTNE